MITNGEARIAIYPGTFDPITLGHLDLICRCTKLVDKVVVAILRNEDKKPLFTLEERIEMLEDAVREIPHVEVDAGEVRAGEIADHDVVGPAEGAVLDCFDVVEVHRHAGDVAGEEHTAAVGDDTPAYELAAAPEAPTAPDAPRAADVQDQAELEDLAAATPG